MLSEQKLPAKCSQKQNAPCQNALHQNSPKKNAPLKKMLPFKMLPEKKGSPVQSSSTDLKLI